MTKRKPNGQFAARPDKRLCRICRIYPKYHESLCVHCMHYERIVSTLAWKELCFDYKGRACTFCGQVFPRAATCFRHLVPGPSLKRFYTRRDTLPAACLAELDKTVVCCFNCERLHFRYAGRTSKKKLDVLSLLGSACYNCGLEYEPPCLDIHHMNPEGKTETLSSWNVSSWSQMAIDLETASVLCSCCHKIEHNEQKVLDRFNHYVVSLQKVGEGGLNPPFKRMIEKELHYLDIHSVETDALAAQIKDELVRIDPPKEAAAAALLDNILPSGGTPSDEV